MANFSLDRFESCIHNRAYDDAIGMLIDLDALLGRWPNTDLASLMLHDSTPVARATPERFVIRAAAALDTLLSDRCLVLDDARMKRLLSVRPLIWRIFAASPLANADHAARKFLPVSSGNDVTLPCTDAIKRLSILVTPESRLPLDISVLWKLDLPAASSLCMGIAGDRFPGNVSANTRREESLRWLSERLEDLVGGTNIDFDTLNTVYMHCTYAGIVERHAVKRRINALVRAKLAQLQMTDLAPYGGQSRPAERTRPVMIVLAERFIQGHSIVRTHSRTLAAARERFELVAFCPPDSIDDEGRRLFDRTYDLPPIADVLGSVRQIREFAKREHPDVFYMPSVGMSTLTIFMSNVRVAALQIAGLGHPATTHSGQIDYVSVEDDFVGDPSCFSESLLRLPKDGQPYAPSALLGTVTPRVPDARAVVHIAVAASFMKLNADFLAACRSIIERTGGRVHLHFLTSGGTVLSLMHLCRIAERTFLRGTFTIHGFTPYPDYVSCLNDADMFLSPFPFGNTNGIVDAFTVGLPGVCKTGSEVFERIDGALFARAWMPGWLIADTVDEYVDAAVILATDRALRESLRASMLERNAVGRLFEGRPEVFGEMVLERLRERQPALHCP